MKMTNDGCVEIEECPDWTNIEEVEEDQDIVELYPNPATYEVNISKMDKNTRKRIRIELYDVVGKYVKSTSISKNEFSSKIDVSSLSNGLYFCKILVDGDVVDVKKLVVHR